MILEDLFEAASPVLYHYTNAHAAVDIIRNNRFQLSISAGSSEEQKWAPPGYDYFLSLTRTRVGDYHRYASNGAVMFVLDGTWFRGRYPVKPIDYWERSWLYPQTDRTRESEDRVFSREPEIPASAIVAAHVLLTTQQEHRSYNVRQLLIACRQRGIPAYLYTDEAAWRLQDTRKSVPPSQVPELLRGQQPRGYTGRTWRGMEPWIELLHKKSRRDLSKDAEKLFYTLKYYPRDDAQLAIDVSNARKPGPGSGRDRKYAIEILRYMQQHGLPTLRAFRDAMEQKWRAIQDQEKPLRENDAEHRSALQQTGFWGRQGAGCVFMALDTGRVCLAHRSAAVEQPGTWGTWGGAIDSGEDPAEAVRREVAEEAGYQGPSRLVSLLVFSHPSGFRYYNFLALVPQEFDPQLDWETQDSAWFEPGEWPSPLHPGMIALLRDPASMQIIQHLQTRIKNK